MQICYSKAYPFIFVIPFHRSAVADIGTGLARVDIPLQDPNTCFSSNDPFYISIYSTSTSYFAITAWSTTAVLQLNLPLAGMVPANDVHQYQLTTSANQPEYLAVSARVGNATVYVGQGRKTKCHVLRYISIR